MKAVILAAGKGTRMKELTASQPKPMVPVRGKPVLQWIIEGLRDHAGVTNVFLVVGYQGDVIRNYFGDGDAFGVNIEYGEQEVQNGTGKAPEVARDWVARDNFLLTYGDIFLPDPAAYAIIAAAWQETDDALVTVKTAADLSKFGAVFLDLHDYMTDLVEKGNFPKTPNNAYANVGIYIFTPRLFTYTSELTLSPRGEYELTDALRAMIDDSAKIRGVRMKGEWVDVRDPEIVAELNAGAASAS
ncbi:nucleotidyl transferase [Verrucomicrobia bacterium LW23]|nr:nucleotidyl transferase [Verrucomicrobia bacterium LW23]